VPPNIRDEYEYGSGLHLRPRANYGRLARGTALVAVADGAFALGTGFRRCDGNGGRVQVQVHAHVGPSGWVVDVIVLPFQGQRERPSFRARRQRGRGPGRERSETASSAPARWPPRSDGGGGASVLGTATAEYVDEHVHDCAPPGSGGSAWESNPPVRGDPGRQRLWRPCRSPDPARFLV